MKSYPPKPKVVIDTTIPERKKMRYNVPCVKCGKTAEYHNSFYDTDHLKGDIMFLCPKHQKLFYDLIKKWRDE